MTPHLRLNDVKAIFEQVVDLPPDERSLYLDEACTTEDIRRRVERMLAVDERDDWLVAPTRVRSNEVFDDWAAEVAIPERVGRYAIRRRIAVGGMGTVYEGVQDEPRRIVAVKVMRRHLVQRAALRRFHDEAHILGRLRHPAIAQIFDAAVHRDDGDDLPYFVMEYVPGARSLTSFARARELGTRERIELFIRVCEGVHHGHQKGIVHRDLKPDNLLVDGAGHPKIIDFGVARATDADVALTTMRTDVGQLIGTLQYMSPEQLEGDPRDIDTRSDVYALGVVLFELLTGKTPRDIHGLTVSEALQVLRESKPSRLSAFQPKLRGDLETIVTKALERDRDRRYQSTLELAQDLGRYLVGEAIAARPPSLVYHLRVAARRHQPAAIATVLLLGVITAAAAVSTVMYFKVETARAETAEERDDAIEARNRAQAVETFLASMLTAVAPESPDDEIAFRAILDKATGMVHAGEFDEQPITEAAVRRILANAYESQGLQRESYPHKKTIASIYERELGPEARETLIARMRVAGSAYALDDHWSEAKTLAAETLARCRRTLAPDDRLLRRAVISWALATQSVDAWRQALEVRIAFDGPDSGSAHFGRHVYGMALSIKGGAPKQGRVYQEQALAFFIKQNDTRRSLGTNENASRQFLCATYNKLGLFGQAETLAAPLMPIVQEELRSRRPFGAAAAQTALFAAVTLIGQGRLDEAEAALRLALPRARDTLGDGFWSTAALATSLADVLRETGRLEEATEIALDDERFADITDDEQVYLTNRRAKLLLDAGHSDAALRHARLALANIEAVEGNWVETRLVAAEVLLEIGSTDEAAEQLDLVIAYYDEKCEPMHPGRARARRLLGAVRAAENDGDAAEAAFREAIDLDLEWRGIDDRETAKSRLVLGRYLANVGRIAEAQAELAEARRIFETSAFDEGLWQPRVESALAALNTSAN